METLDELVSELQNAESEIRNANYDGEKVHNEMDAPQESITKNLTEEKRTELIRCSEDGEIDQSVKYLKKASGKVITKIYDNLEEQKTGKKQTPS